ncbi:MAG: homoserine dehydrogenase [Clostridia bacterium]|nr:homoserine dehydrogenase [Clostridia bacterium]
MQKIKVGFLGCGNIGGGVWMLLEDMRHDFAVKHQISFEVKKMLVRALDEKRAVEVPLDRLTTNVNEIIDDPEISLVCEFMGGEQPAAQFMLAALKAGKHVVTANKMALSLHWQELHQAAAENNVGLYYEASVCGAIPVIRTIRESMAGSRVDRIGGIVNGTTNYILTQMSEHGLSYQVALAQAQELGLAEPDPTSDVEGHDAAY